MENITNEKQLLAVSRAAKVLHLGKDTMYKLIEEGKIGYIAIGKRKKIPASELDGFKERNLTFEKTESTSTNFTPREIDEFLFPRRNESSKFNANEFISSALGGN